MCSLSLKSVWLKLCHKIMFGQRLFNYDINYSRKYFRNKPFHHKRYSNYMYLNSLLVNKYNNHENFDVLL